MRKIVITATLMILTFGMFAVPALAQDKATELTAGVLGFGYTTCKGFDGVLEVATGGTQSGRYIGLTGGSFAVGFYSSPGFAIEPTLGFSRLSSDGDAVSVLNLGIAMPFYPEKGWGRTGHYIAPRVTYNRISSDSDSESQFTIGLAIGTKTRLNDMAALRLQAFFDYGLEGDDGELPSTKTFGMFVGLSTFLD